MGFTDITFQHLYGLYRAAGHHLPQLFLHEPDSRVHPPPPPPPLPAVKTNALHSLPNENAPGRTPCNITPQSANSAASAGKADACSRLAFHACTVCLLQGVCTTSRGDAQVVQALSTELAAFILASIPVQSALQNVVRGASLALRFGACSGTPLSMSPNGKPSFQSTGATPQMRPFTPATAAPANISSAGQGFKPSPASSASASDQGASGLSCGPALAI